MSLLPGRDREPPFLSGAPRDIWRTPSLQRLAVPSKHPHDPENIAVRTKRRSGPACPRHSVSASSRHDDASRVHDSTWQRYSPLSTVAAAVKAGSLLTYRSRRTYGNSRKSVQIRSFPKPAPPTGTTPSAFDFLEVCSETSQDPPRPDRTILAIEYLDSLSRNPFRWRDSTFVRPRRWGPSDPSNLLE